MTWRRYLLFLLFPVRYEAMARADVERLEEKIASRDRAYDRLSKNFANHYEPTYYAMRDRGLMEEKIAKLEKENSNLKQLVQRSHEMVSFRGGRFGE